MAHFITANGKVEMEPYSDDFGMTIEFILIKVQRIRAGFNIIQQMMFNSRTKSIEDILGYLHKVTFEIKENVVYEKLINIFEGKGQSVQFSDWTYIPQNIDTPIYEFERILQFSTQNIEELRKITNLFEELGEKRKQSVNDPLMFALNDNLFIERYPDSHLIFLWSEYDDFSDE
ncbi:hypothetical protein HNQ34_003066 [Anoxybacillus tepidamans]|uniref:Uncharacterized protein n=1 Tax=Anoxybacteroides tepidamans TaxID=265948 RepID=A0A7W8ISL0_9BACL|nr:hypothetical protein [Anoxybacillus tepidamans]MBB5325960.1 hypothetical protein [Anoxybacillus tepidamans]